MGGWKVLKILKLSMSMNILWLSLTTPLGPHECDIFSSCIPFKSRGKINKLHGLNYSLIVLWCNCSKSLSIYLLVQGLQLNAWLLYLVMNSTIIKWHFFCIGTHYVKIAVDICYSFLLISGWGLSEGLIRALAHSIWRNLATLLVKLAKTTLVHFG